MEQGRLAMSQRDRDRLAVLRQAQKKRLGQRQAAEELGISERQVRRLVRRLGAEGDRGIVHGLRGRASPRRIPAKVEARAVALVGERYSDFGPTLAAECLAEREGIAVSRETLRQWLIRSGHWKRRRRAAPKVHQWRARRERCGELVQWDTSTHDWLEGRGPRIKLVAMMDDATSRLWARFVAEDSAEENLRVLDGYLRRWGRPVAFYTDKASLFQVNRPADQQEQLAGREAETQIGRALRELGIKRIAAHSPQAKGRIERQFATAQDRLVKGLRLAAAGTLAQANAYLDQRYLPHWNRRFTRPAKNPADAHRRPGPEHRLESILSICAVRRVNDDYTLQHAGRRYRFPTESIRPGLRRASVRVERRLDGSLTAIFRGQALAILPCPEPQRPQPPAPSRLRASLRIHGSHWMDGFTFSPRAGAARGRP